MPNMNDFTILNNFLLKIGMFVFNTTIYVLCAQEFKKKKRKYLYRKGLNAFLKTKLS